MAGVKELIVGGVKIVAEIIISAQGSKAVGSLGHDIAIFKGSKALLGLGPGTARGLVVLALLFALLIARAGVFVRSRCAVANTWDLSFGLGLQQREPRCH